jgi:hypothetical protein
MDSNTRSASRYQRAARWKRSHNGFPTATLREPRGSRTTALGSGTDEQVTGVSDEQGRPTETTSPAEETTAQAAGPALGDEAETELHAAALPQLPMADAVGCRILRGCKRS